MIPRLAFLFVLVIAAYTAAQIRSHASDGIWEDEGVALYVSAAPSVGEFLHRQIASDYSPPLFNSLLALWRHVFGVGESSLGWLEALIGGALIAATGWAGLEIGGVLAGMFSALLAATNPLLCRMTVQVRPYAFTALLGALAIALLARLRRRADTGRVGAGTTLAVTAALSALALVHYSGALAVFAIGIASIAGMIRGRERLFWKHVLGASLVAGLMLVPWVPILMRQLGVGLPWAPVWPPWIRWFNVQEWFFDVVPAIGPNQPVGFLLFFSFFAAVGFAFRRTLWRAIRPVAPALVGLASLAAIDFLPFGVRTTAERYVTIVAAFCSIFFGVLLAKLLATIWAERRGPVLAVAIGLLFFGGALWTGASARPAPIAANRPIPRSGIRSVFLGHFFQPGDLVVVAPDYLAPTAWYYMPKGTRLKGFVRWDDAVLTDFRGYREKWWNPDAVEEAMTSIVAEAKRSHTPHLLLITDFNFDSMFREPTENLRAELAHRFPPEQDRYFTAQAEFVRATRYDLRSLMPR